MCVHKSYAYVLMDKLFITELYCVGLYPTCIVMYTVKLLNIQ